jgi:DNA-binding response OmpR family regulator
MRVLLIEDDTATAQSIELMLNTLGEEYLLCYRNQLS